MARHFAFFAAGLVAVTVAVACSSDDISPDEGCAQSPCTCPDGTSSNTSCIEPYVGQCSCHQDITLPHEDGGEVDGRGATGCDVLPPPTPSRPDNSCFRPFRGASTPATKSGGSCANAAFECGAGCCWKGSVCGWCRDGVHDCCLPAGSHNCTGNSGGVDNDYAPGFACGQGEACVADAGCCLEPPCHACAAPEPVPNYGKSEPIPASLEDGGVLFGGTSVNRWSTVGKTTVAVERWAQACNPTDPACQGTDFNVAHVLNSSTRTWDSRPAASSASAYPAELLSTLPLAGEVLVPLKTGFARYNPTTNAWNSVAVAGAPPSSDLTSTDRSPFAAGAFAIFPLRMTRYDAAGDRWLSISPNADDAKPVTFAGGKALGFVVGNDNGAKTVRVWRYDAATDVWDKGASYRDDDTSSDVQISALPLGGESRFGVLAFTLPTSLATTMLSAALYDALADRWLPIAPEPAFLCNLGGWPQHGVATERAVILNTKAYYDVAAQRWAQPAKFDANDPNIAMRTFEGQPAMCVGSSNCYKWTPPDTPPNPWCVP